MADEITVTASLALDRYTNQLQPQLAFGPKLVTMTGNAQSQGVQLIGTTKENLDINADHSTTGWCLLRNLDDTNWVGIGADADAPFIKIKFGEFALFRLAGSTTISAKADTSPVLLFFWILED